MHDAIVERRAADEQRELAKTNALQAVESEARARRLLYAADIALAQQSIASGILGRARRLLDRHRPASGEKDLRGWEWRWLWEQCRARGATLTRHTDRAFTTSFSPDGKYLAVAYMDGRIELWDPATRTLLKLLQTGGGGNIAIFAPQANALVFTSSRRTLRWYDVATDRAQPLCRLPGVIRDMAFSEDGTRLAVLTYALNSANTAKDRHAALVLDAQSGEIIADVPLAAAGGGLLNNVRLSPDHALLYVTDGAFRKPRLRCVRLADQSTVWESDGRGDAASLHFTGFTAMDLSPDGKFLATACGYDGQAIQIRNAETGERIATLDGHTRYVMRLSFRRDGALLASASSDETVRLWDVKTWAPLGGPLRGHSDEVHGVAFSREGQLLATGSKNGEVMLWDEASRRNTDGRQALPDDVRIAHLLPGGRTIVAGATSGSLSLITTTTLQRVTLPLPTDWAATFIPPNFVTIFDMKERAQLYELSDTGAKLVAELRAGGPLKVHMAFCPKTRVLAWNEEGQGLCLVPVDHPENRIVFTSDKQRVDLPIRFDPEGKFLLTVDPSDVPSVWEIASRQRVAPAEEYFRWGGARTFGVYFANARNSPALL
ncbi:MAG TPA: WD40 repeat domain-containing protein, partial [Chthoniobacteraceae bacterium]|nr:WD40 repeat domain-containing protein [Chthoniobacteraceae bacterium]